MSLVACKILCRNYDFAKDYKTNIIFFTGLFDYGLLQSNSAHDWNFQFSNVMTGLNQNYNYHVP